MSIHDVLTDAIDEILATDVSDESLSEAVLAQACLMANINPDEIAY
jgi:hypothetical protein